jgi:two-component system, sensor histidine kinase LadS
MHFFALRVGQIVCCLFFLGQPLLAWAGDLVVQRDVLEDRSGRLKIDQVAGFEGFRPLGGLLVGGYSDSSWWLRLRIAPSSDGQPVLLRVRPTFLDDVRLYNRAPDGRWHERTTGDRFAFDSADRSLNALGFQLEPAAQTSTYYLRLKTTSSVMLHVQALPKTDAARKDAQLVFFQVTYFAFMTGVLLWSVLAWWRGREAVMGTFAIYQFVSLLHAMALTGYLAPFDAWPVPGWTDAFTSIFVLMTAGSGFLFHAVVLGMYAPSRGLLRVMWALVAVAPVLLVMYWLGHERLALQLNAMAVLLAGLLMFLLALSARREGLPSLRVLRTIYTLQALSVAASMLPFMGWVPALEWNLQASLIHGFISACLMFYMLDQRARLMRAEAEGNRQRAILAEQSLHIKAQEVAAQGRSFDVLTHELKTPISVAMMSLGAAPQQGDPNIVRARRAIGHLNAVVERMHLSVLADSRRLQAQLEPSNVSVLLYECIEDCRSPERIRAAVGFQLEALTDGHLFSLIANNLIDNALKYSPPESWVEVHLEALNDPPRRGLRLRVINTEGSAGAPDPARLFKKYYRSPGAQSISGSGLGLFLSHHLAELIGAQLSHQRHPLQVEFDLFLPEESGYFS